MKYLFFILTLTLLVSCSSNTEYTYEVIFTDGTSEIVKTRDTLKFTGKSDCIASCGCGSKTVKLCGVRKFDLMSTRIIDGDKKSSVSDKPSYREITD